MSVSLKLHRPSKVVGNRSKGFNVQVRAAAESILEAQAAGHLAPKEIVAYFDVIGIEKFLGGKWSVAAMRRALHRGRQLGFDFTIQTNAMAGARPRSRRRTRDEIERDMMERRLASKLRLAATALNAVAISAGTICSMGDKVDA